MWTTGRRCAARSTRFAASDSPSRRRSGRIEDWLLIAATATIAVLVGLGVVMRYVLNDPLTWAEEFVVTLFVWSIMLGIPAALRSNMHIRIDA